MRAAVRPIGRLEHMLSGAVLCVSLLTFGSQSVQFYAYWLFGILTVAVAALLVLLNQRLRRSILNTLVLMSAWIMVALLMSPYATDVRTHLTMTGLTIFYATLATCLVATVLSSVPRFSRTIAWCAGIWTVVNLALLLAFMLGLVDYQGRAFSGVYYNRNTLAVVGCILFLFLLFLPSRQRPGRVDGLRVCLLLGVTTLVVATLSTKGVVGLMLVVGGYLWTKLAKRQRFLGVGLVLGLAVAVVLIDSATSQRLVAKLDVVAPAADVAEAGVGASGYQRLWLLLESARLIAQHPLTGVGVHNSQFHLFTERYYLLVARGDLEAGSVGVYSHNNYTEMLLNAGVFAFLLYYAPLVWLWRKVAAHKHDRSLRNIRGLILTGLLVKAFLDVGMVSYFEFSHLVLVATMWMLYFGHMARSQSSVRGANLVAQESLGATLLKRNDPLLRKR